MREVDVIAWSKEEVTRKEKEKRGAERRGKEMKRGEKRGEREEERRGEVKRKEKRREASPARFVHLDRGICVWFVGLDWRRRCRQVSISGMGRARAAPSFSSSWYSYATASTNCCSSQTPQLSYISRSTCTLILYQLLLYRLFFVSIEKHDSEP